MISFETFNQTGLVAQAGGGLALLGTHLLAAIAFSVVGIAVLVTCFMIIKRMLPFSVTKEIEEDQNVALAIIIASVILGLSIIIAAAILGVISTRRIRFDIPPSTFDISSFAL